MQKLVDGVHNFQRDIFGGRRALFERLAREQHPLALFITCSDSRINPNLLTQTEPGELFILRNAGNIVPAHQDPPDDRKQDPPENRRARKDGPVDGKQDPPEDSRARGSAGEAATIEFAVAGLGVRDIVVCGHSQCGAMHGLLQPDALARLPEMRRWLKHAERTSEIIRQKYAHLSGEALLTATVEENVLVQIEQLRSHPSVAAGLARGELRLYGWVYKLETGGVFNYDPAAGQFVALSQGLVAPVYAGPAI